MGLLLRRDVLDDLLDYSSNKYIQSRRPQKDNDPRAGIAPMTARPPQQATTDKGLSGSSLSIRVSVHI